MKPVMLLDIEGTTTPIDFVHQVLFPFAKAGIEDFVAQNSADLDEEFEELRHEASLDSSYSKPVHSTPEIIGYLRYLIDVDRKSTPLKTIQGKLWASGYASGELVSEVYDDVADAFRRWKAAGRIVAIYSSGSIEAQQLLFRYSDKGDLTEYIDDYFDTTSGNKKEKKSYLNIIDSLGVETSDVIFVSDVIEELEAAEKAGLRTTLSIRPGNKEIEVSHSYRTIESFEELE